MSAAVQPIRRPAVADVPVSYRWDAATGILSARLEHGGLDGPEGQLAMAGRDGSWVTLDLRGDRLVGIDVVVWPDVRHLSGLVAPICEPRTLSWRRLAESQRLRAVSAPLVCDATPSGSIVHIRLAARRPARTVREARDVCIDLDAGGSFAGIWLLNLPPCPEGA